MSVVMTKDSELKNVFDSVHLSSAQKSIRSGLLCLKDVDPSDLAKRSACRFLCLSRPLLYRPTCTIRHMYLLGWKKRGRRSRRRKRQVKRRALIKRRIKRKVETNDAEEENKKELDQEEK